jgi:hypothetical protein
MNTDALLGQRVKSNSKLLTNVLSKLERALDQQFIELFNESCVRSAFDPWVPPRWGPTGVRKDGTGAQRRLRDEEAASLLALSQETPTVTETPR